MDSEHIKVTNLQCKKHSAFYSSKFWMYGNFKVCLHWYFILITYAVSKSPDIHTYCALNSITEWSWILESSKLDFFCETKREHIQEYSLQTSSASACITHKARLLLVQRTPPFTMSAYNINADFLEQTVLCRIILILPYYSVAYTYPYLPGFFSN